MADPQAWYMGLPPFTRAVFTAAVVTGVGARFGFVDPGKLAFWPSGILKQFQLWRIVTPFTWFGKLGFDWVMSIMMLTRFMPLLESDPFPSGGGPGGGNAADFYWMMVLGAVLILAFAVAMGTWFLGISLLTYTIFMWSRKHPEESASFWMFRVPAKWLPFVMIGWDFVVSNDPVPGMIGVAAGGVVNYVLNYLPNSVPGANKYLCTPQFVYRLLQLPPTGFSVRRTAGGGFARPQVPAAQPIGGHRWGTGQTLGRVHQD